VPAVTSGEISRVVYTARNRTVKHVSQGEARVGRRYELVTACISDNGERIVKYELLSSEPGSDTSVVSSEMTCDGEVTSISLPLPATGIQIALGPGLSGVKSAYAVLTISS
jgi:hypothetical protein